MIKKSIAVGSKNPTKIQAVEDAFKTLWPDIFWKVTGVEVDSGVSNQPMSDSECVEGARNRALRSLKKLNTDFGVGLEGGLQKIADKWFDCGWIVVRNQGGHEGIGSTVKMMVPNVMLTHINNGIELGIVIDMVFKTKNAKQKQGHFGLMTKNAITRTAGYRDGVIAALAAFIHEELFKQNG